MTGKTRWHFIPETVPLCVLNLAVGVFLAATAIWQLASASEESPVFTIVLLVAAVPLIVSALAGLAVPRLRGR